MACYKYGSVDISNVSYCWLFSLSKETSMMVVIVFQDYALAFFVKYLHIQGSSFQVASPYKLTTVTNLLSLGSTGLSISKVN